MLARNGGEGGAAPSNAPHGGQHGSGPTLDVGTLDDQEKLDALPASIAAGEAVTVSGLWTSHSEWPAVARTHEQLFLSSIEVAPDLLDHFEDERDAFKRSVEGRARNHLSENRQFVMEEQAKLGIPVEASFDGAGTPEEQAKRLGEVKALAAEAQRALRAKQDLLAIRVGVNGSAVDEGASGAPAAFEVVTFNPDRKPQQSSTQEGFKTWDEVNGHWTELEAAIAHMEATSPALFALLNAEGLDDDAARADEAGQLAADDDEVALSKLETAMRVLEGKLDEVFDEIGSEYEWDDLGLLFPQVLADEQWSKPIDNAIAKKLIKDDADSAAALDAGLTAVGLVAALVGVFATGGMALALTVVGAAAGGTQAVISTDDYLKKQALREARTGKKQHDLVAQETVDAARVKAIVDVVFAFLDAADLGKGDQGGRRRRGRRRQGGTTRRAGRRGEGERVQERDGRARAAEGARHGRRARRREGAAGLRLGRRQARAGLLRRARPEMGDALGGKKAREEAAKAVGPDAVADPADSRRRPRLLRRRRRPISSSRRRTSRPQDGPAGRARAEGRRARGGLRGGDRRDRRPWREGRRGHVGGVRPARHEGGARREGPRGRGRVGRGAQGAGAGARHGAERPVLRPAEVEGRLLRARARREGGDDTRSGTCSARRASTRCAMRSSGSTWRAWLSGAGSARRTSSRSSRCTSRP